MRPRAPRRASTWTAGRAAAAASRSASRRAGPFRWRTSSPTAAELGPPDGPRTARAHRAPGGLNPVREIGRRAIGRAQLAELVQAALQYARLELVERQADENQQPALQCVERLRKCLAPLRIAALDRRGIVDSPVRAHLPAGPGRAGFAGRLAADREYEIHPRRAGPRELIPAFAAQPLRRQAVFFDQLEREGIHLPGGTAAGAVGAEPAVPEAVQQGLGKDAARRITGADEKDIEWTDGHFWFPAVRLATLC